MGTLPAQIRVLDTRVKNQPLKPMEPRRVSILPTPPEWAGAVRVNILATEPVAGGWLSFDGGTTTKVNYATGWTIANEVSVPLKNDGTWYVEVTANIQTHIVVDVCGFDSLI